VVELADIRVGTSGWSYDHWRNRFYPDGMPSTKRLSFYAREFDTVEVNTSFYHLPRETTFSNWRGETPEGFVFAVKGSRFVTHVKKLVDVEDAVLTLCQRAMILGDKLGPLLWQLSPQLKRDDDRLEGFLRSLPESLSHVIEFRRQGWFCREVYDLLRRYDVSICSVSSPSIVTDLVVTGRVGYLRMHGEEGWYSSNYDEQRLRSWADRIVRDFSSCSEAYIYFNNDANAYAVDNARYLRRQLS
jgi:uncharacterized protein YecE (DUF72 family)